MFREQLEEFGLAIRGRGDRRGRRHRGGARARLSSGRSIESSKRTAGVRAGGHRWHEVIDGRHRGGRLRRPDRALGRSCPSSPRRPALRRAARPALGRPAPAGRGVGCQRARGADRARPAHAAPCTRTAPRSSTSAGAPGPPGRATCRRRSGRATSSWSRRACRTRPSRRAPGARAGLLLPAPRPRGQHRGADRPRPLRLSPDTCETAGLARLPLGPSEHRCVLRSRRWQRESRDDPSVPP